MTSPDESGAGDHYIFMCVLVAIETDIDPPGAGMAIPTVIITPLSITTNACNNERLLLVHG
jgi:hypothetical protein